MTSFFENIYSILRKVPAGRVTTYKYLADAVDSKAYRAVGQAMKNNPYAPEVPCHRVVKSDGSIGGFMGKTTGEEVRKKIQMLVKEGVVIKEGKIVNFDKVKFSFK